MKKKIISTALSMLSIIYIGVFAPFSAYADIDDVVIDTFAQLYEDSLNSTNEAVTKTVAELIRQIKENPNYPTQTTFDMPNITCFHGYRITETINDKGIKHQFSIEDIFYYVDGTVNGFFNKAELVYYNKRTGKYYKPNTLYRTYINDVGEIANYVYTGEFSVTTLSPTDKSWLKMTGFSITAPSFEVEKIGYGKSQYNIPVTFKFLSYYENTDNYAPKPLDNYIQRPNMFAVLNSRFLGWGDDVGTQTALQVYPYENYIVTNRYSLKYINLDQNVEMYITNTKYAEYGLDTTTLINFTTNSQEFNNQIEKRVNAPNINYYYQNDLIYNNSYPLTQIENNYQNIVNNVNNKYPTSMFNPTISDDYKEWEEDDVLFTLPKLEIPSDTLPPNILQNSGAMLQKALDVFDAMEITAILFVLAVISIVALFLIK